MNQTAPNLLSGRSAREKHLNALMVGGLCLMPLTAVLAPRLLAFAPGMMAVVGLALICAARGGWPAFSKPLLFWMAAIVALCAFSSLWGLGDLAVMLRRSAGIALIIFSGAGLLALCGPDMPDMKEGFTRFFPAFLLAAALLCLIDLYGGGYVYRLLRAGEVAEFNPSQLNRGIVAISLMSLPALVALWRGPGGRLRRYAAVAVIFAAIGAVLYKTDSQSAQFGFLTGIAFLVFFPYRHRVAWVGLGAGIAALMALAPILAQWMFAGLAFTAEQHAWLARGYAPDRMEIWDFIARKALESPLIGFGLEATREIPHFDTRNVFTPLDHVLHPHNAVLQIWIEFGVLGIAVASGFMVFILRGLYRQGPRGGKPGLPVFMASLAAAAVSYGLWQGWWLGLFMLLAACCRIVSGTKERRDKEDVAI